MYIIFLPILFLLDFFGKRGVLVGEDENIFNYIKCINVPRTPTCDSVKTGGGVCRSRQIDCNKFKLYLTEDPVAVARMKLITDSEGQLKDNVYYF